MKIAQIRSLGFDWPGSPSMDQYAVETGGDIDLDATIAALRRGLEVYQGQLDDMHAFQRDHNADWNDVSDHQGDYAEKAAEMRRAIALAEAIKAKAKAKAP
jgi:hypothetical protein